MATAPAANVVASQHPSATTLLSRRDARRVSLPLNRLVSTKIITRLRNTPTEKWVLFPNNIRQAAGAPTKITPRVLARFQCSRRNAESKRPLREWASIENPTRIGRGALSLSSRPPKRDTQERWSRGCCRVPIRSNLSGSTTIWKSLCALTISYI